MSTKETIEKNLELLVDSGNGINHAAMLANPTSRVVGEEVILFEARLSFEYDSQSGSINEVFPCRIIKQDVALGTITYSSSYNNSFVSRLIFDPSTSDDAKLVLSESFSRYNKLPESEKTKKPKAEKKRFGILDYLGLRKRN
ncbi:hypothetical protein COU60_02115 [Candidatus Pacearchaeota archaeon CG10_big_fil_rev_8_21_14_0_10_34_76]|nr:MAG: hypothetical protein COU60_02115 [Candidatus Pacearchaeota archaeon CG10_big_fil_rev_8_21_14_0_10_34_76]